MPVYSLSLSLSLFLSLSLSIYLSLSLSIYFSKEVSIYPHRVTITSLISGLLRGPPTPAVPVSLSHLIPIQELDTSADRACEGPGLETRAGHLVVFSDHTSLPTWRRKQECCSEDAVHLVVSTTSVSVGQWVGAIG